MELWFRYGRRDWQSDYENTRVFLCDNPRCQICNLTEKEKLKGVTAQELKLDVELWRTRRPGIWSFGPKAWCAHLREVIEQREIKIDEGIEFDMARLNLVVYRLPQGLIVVDPGSMGFNGQALSLDKFLPAGEKILAVIITHGHQDHWSQLRDFPEMGAGVFMDRTTHQLISRHAAFQRDSRLESALKKAKIVAPGNPIVFNNIRVETFPLPHSVPGTMGLVIKGPRLRVVHLADFKLTGWTPETKAATISNLQRIARERIDILSVTIPNVHLDGFVSSEVQILGAIVDIMTRSQGRVIISCFSSNLERIRRISEIARIMGRPVQFFGTGMQFNQQNLKIKTNLGLIDKSVIFVTGCQAEEQSVLWRIAKKENPPFQFRPGDTLIFSSRAIPGNEPGLNWLARELRSQVDEIVMNVGEVEHLGLEGLGIKEMPTHFSGHEFGGGLEMVMEICRPQKLLAWPQTSPQIEALRKITEKLEIEILPETNRSIEI